MSSKNKALNKLQTDKTGNDTDCEAKKINEVKEQIDALKHHPWRHLIFSHQINEETFKKHLILTYRGLVYAKKCLKGPSDKFIKTKQVLVPDAKCKPPQLPPFSSLSGDKPQTPRMDLLS